MPIDPSLLTKAAKVYEAAEAVEGEKPKQVYESHKKCAPGEFGMNKEGTFAHFIKALCPVGAPGVAPAIKKSAEGFGVQGPDGAPRSQAYPKNSLEAMPQSVPAARRVKLTPQAKQAAFEFGRLIGRAL